MAAAVADYRPAEALAAKRPKDAAPLDARARADDRRPRATRRAPRATARCSSASPPTTGERAASSARARSSRARTPISSSSTTSPRRTSASTPADNEVTLARGEPASATVAKAPKEEIAAAILDEVERLSAG